MCKGPLGGVKSYTLTTLECVYYIIIGSLKRTAGTSNGGVDYFHSLVGGVGRGWGALMTFRRDKSSFWVRRANPFAAAAVREDERVTRHKVLTAG